jgi:DNA-directed RNA polymerase beta subunit
LLDDPGILGEQADANADATAALRAFRKGFKSEITKDNFKENLQLVRNVIFTRAKAQTIASFNIDVLRKAMPKIPTATSTIDTLEIKSNNEIYKILESQRRNNCNKLKFNEIINEAISNHIHNNITPDHCAKVLEKLINEIKQPESKAIDAASKTWYARGCDLIKSMAKYGQKQYHWIRGTTEQVNNEKAMTNVLRKIDRGAIKECNEWVVKRDKAMEEIVAPIPPRMTPKSLKAWKESTQLLQEAIAYSGRYKKLIEKESKKIDSNNNNKLPTHAVENSFAYTACIHSYDQAAIKAKEVLDAIANLAEPTKEQIDTAQQAFDNAKELRSVTRQLLNYSNSNLGTLTRGSFFPREGALRNVTGLAITTFVITHTPLLASFFISWGINLGISVILENTEISKNVNVLRNNLENLGSIPKLLDRVKKFYWQL